MTVLRITSPFTARVSTTTKKTSRKEAANHQKKKKRQVQFALGTQSSEFSIQAQRIEASYELTTEMCRDAWWSPEERKEHAFERNFLTKKFQLLDARKDAATGETKPTADDTFRTLYNNCATMSISQVMRTKQAKKLLHDFGASGDDYDGVLRGLEGKVAKTISQRRKFHVHAMLSILRSEGAAVETLKQSSRASEVLARVIGILDSRQATKE